jgi:site-specific DNA-methyltransferase (cytosine-N4-specific)
MKELLVKGYNAKKRPSGHDISGKFNIDNGAAIPPNLIAIPNTESNSAYIRYCQERDIKVHPARYPADLPEYFIRMLTNEGDVVFDPFGGSCVTGEVAERLNRKWVCCELVEEYLEGALGRFMGSPPAERPTPKDESSYYKVPRPGLLWDGQNESIAADGGQVRKVKKPLKDASVKTSAVSSKGSTESASERPIAIAAKNAKLF